MGTGYNAASKLHSMFEDASGDAKQEIRESVGGLDGFEVWGDLVLIGVYCHPPETKGKFLVGGTTQLEDVWQGKVGMILKIGPDAFPEAETTFGGMKPQLGDWVYHNVQDTMMQLSLAGDGWIKHQITAPNGQVEFARGWDGWPVRLVHSRDIHGRITTPGIIV